MLALRYTLKQILYHLLVFKTQRIIFDRRYLCCTTLQSVIHTYQKALLARVLLLSRLRIMALSASFILLHDQMHRNTHIHERTHSHYNTYTVVEEKSEEREREAGSSRETSPRNQLFHDCSSLSFIKTEYLG